MTVKAGEGKRVEAVVAKQPEDKNESVATDTDATTDDALCSARPIVVTAVIPQ